MKFNTVLVTFILLVGFPLGYLCHPNVQGMFYGLWLAFIAVWIAVYPTMIAWLVAYCSKINILGRSITTVLAFIAATGTIGFNEFKYEYAGLCGHGIDPIINEARHVTVEEHTYPKSAMVYHILITYNDEFCPTTGVWVGRNVIAENQLSN